MNALSRLSSRLSYDDPSRAQAVLVRGVVAGLLGGVVLVAPAALLVSSPASLGPIAAAASAGLLFLLLPQQPASVLLLLGGATAVAALLGSPSLGLLPFFFTAGLGLLLALERETWPRRALALLGPSLGAAWGMQVVTLLTARYLSSAAWLGIAGVLGVGLFIALGAAAAGVEWSADGVEPRLKRDPKVQRTWARLREALARLPETGDRRQLTQLADGAAQRWLAARVEADGVVDAVDDELESRSRDALLQLEVRLETTTDAGVADSLRQLARVHRDTLEQLDGLRRRKERLDAQAAAEAAWLETAAFTVELAPKGAPALHEVTQRLAALGSAR